MQTQKAYLIRILYFLVFCCTASWLPVLADYCKSRGLTGTQISFILSITPIMMFAVQPLYGIFADRYGYKKTLLLASGFAAISYAAYLYHGGYTWLIAVTIVMSVFYNTIQPILDSLSLQLEASNPLFSYGSIRIAGAAGWAFTGIITGQVIDQININMIFVISSISMVLFFGFALMLNNDDKRVIAGNSLPVESASFQNINRIIQNPALLLLLFCVFLISVGATTIWNFYSLYLKENGASASLVGFGLSFQGLCELPLFFFSAAIITRFGLKQTLIITVMATVLRLILYSIIKNPVAAIPIELLHGISWSLFWVVCVEYVNKLVDKNWLATGQSLLYAAYFGIGAIAGNYWTGYLYDRHMKLANIFFLNAGIVFIVGIIIICFVKKVRNEKQAKIST